MIRNNDCGPAGPLWDQGEVEIHFFRKDFTSFYGFSGMSTVNKYKKANVYQIHHQNIHRRCQKISKKMKIVFSILKVPRNTMRGQLRVPRARGCAGRSDPKNQRFRYQGPGFTPHGIPPWGAAPPSLTYFPRADFDKNVENRFFYLKKS